MKRVLVTGAAGFLGSHLCDRFIKEGHYVIGMDNLITGDLKNLQHLRGLPQFEFIHHDVSKHIDISGELDYILHFASPASPIDYLKIPIQTLKVGSLGTHNCLGLAKAKGARILVASTSEVYGDPLVHPQTEDYWGHVNPIGPRGVYDEAKRFQEAITMAYHRYHGLETRIVRIFNTYGPRMRLNDGRVLPAFIGQALRGEDLTVFGDGSQTRSFCYVDDLVEGIHRLLLSDFAEPVNIGNPTEMTIRQFGEEIIQLTGTSQQLVFKPLPQDDPKQRRPDISRAKVLLDWEPQIDRAEGLRRTYAYFQTLSHDELFSSANYRYGTPYEVGSHAVSHAHVAPLLKRLPDRPQPKRQNAEVLRYDSTASEVLLSSELLQNGLKSFQLRRQDGTSVPVLDFSTVGHSLRICVSPLFQGRYDLQIKTGRSQFTRQLFI